MRIRMDKRRSGKIAERIGKRERERGGELKMKGETGPFPTWFMFYTRAKRGGCSRCSWSRHTGHRAAKVTVRSGKLFESFQSFRSVSRVPSIPSARLNGPGLSPLQGLLT